MDGGKRGYLLICLSKKNQAPIMVFPSRFYKDLLASMVASKFSLFSLSFFSLFLSYFLCFMLLAEFSS